MAAKPSQLDENKTNGKVPLCTECGVCPDKCPQGINIPEELKKATAIMEKRQKIEKVYPRDE